VVRPVRTLQACDDFVRCTLDTDSFRVTAVESTEIGGAIGRIKADDPDVGRNAEMEYSVVGGHDNFDVVTDQSTQEGVIVIKKVIYFCGSVSRVSFGGVFR